MGRTYSIILYNNILGIYTSCNITSTINLPHYYSNLHDCSNHLLRYFHTLLIWSILDANHYFHYYFAHLFHYYFCTCLFQLQSCCTCTFRCFWAMWNISRYDFSPSHFRLQHISNSHFCLSTSRLRRIEINYCRTGRVFRNGSIWTFLHMHLTNSVFMLGWSHSTAFTGLCASGSTTGTVFVWVNQSAVLEDQKTMERWHWRTT